MFQAKDDSGSQWKSSSYVGKGPVVVFFFPAAMTGGCTRQACGFRDEAKALTDKGITVIGVSGDSVFNQKFFKEAHNLNFTLLADEDGAVAKAFGVPLKAGGTAKAKDKDGKEVILKRGVTAARWTFVIDKEGKISYKNTSVKAPEDAKTVLKAVGMN